MNATKVFSFPFLEGELKITGVSADLEIRDGENSKIMIEVDLEGETEKVEKYEPLVKRTDNILEIDLENVEGRVVFLSIGHKKDLRVKKATIMIPSTKKLIVSTVAGDITISRPQCEDELRVNTVSGDLSLSESQCLSMELKTTSGDARISNVKALNQFHISSVSGDLLMQDFGSKEIKAETVSGDIVMRNMCDKFHILQLKTISGDINITTPSLPPSKIDYSTLSGAIKVGSQFIKGGKGTLETASPSVAQIKINTISGDVSIEATEAKQNHEESLKVFAELIKTGRATPEQVREMMVLLGFSEEDINTALSS
jgi:DUF4097 and DUF4098 domain-containing protein YvlB